jgi:LysR family glycine cleavage system transcriptional activator
MRPNLIRGLVVFCAAARYLSFKMAANELCITPSAVSHQIKGLEDQIGTSLFERRTRAIVLTPVGAAVYSQIDPLLRSLDAVATSFLINGRRRRVLRITLPPFFASEMLIPQLNKFTRSNPSIDIRVDTAENRETDFPTWSDASVLLTSSEPTGYCVYPLFDVHLVPACSPALAAEFNLSNPQALGACTLIIHEGRPDAWSDWFAAAGAPLEVQPRVIHLDSMFAVARAAEQGLGVALVPMPLTNAWLQSRALVQLFDTALATGERYYFVHRLKDEKDPDIAMLARWVKEACAAHE